MAKTKLFVSYRRSSWSFTYWLSEELGKLIDADIFVDYSGIDETDFESSLLRHLRDSDAVLLIVTDQTFDAARIHHEKDWVRREIREALTLNKPIALACYNGLLPPTDLPEDIQAIRGKQGIEFYSRYFKAGIRELAAFLDKATPVKLQSSDVIAPLPSPTVRSGATGSAHKALLDEAISLHEAGQYDRAIELYDQLMAEQYRPKLLSIQELREKAVAERTAEQRRWDAGEIYDEIAALFRISPERGAEEYAKFMTQYPEFTDDPAGLASRGKARQNQALHFAPIAASGTPADVEMECLAVLKGHKKQVNSVAFNLDGTLLASGGGGYYFSDDTTIHLWDVATREEVGVLVGHSKTVYSVAFSADGSLLASGSEDHTINLWDVAGRRKIAALTGHSSCVNSVAFSPDGKVLASGSWGHKIRLWNVMERQEIAVLTGHSNWIRSVAFNPDGSLLASGCDDTTIRLWDVAERRETGVLKGHSNWVTSVAFSPNGRLMASGSSDNTIRLWDVPERREVAVLTGHTGLIHGLAFNSDGRLMASGSSDNTIRLWDVAERREVAVLTGHTDKVRTVAFSPDGRLLATGSNDQSVRLWGFK